MAVFYTNHTADSFYYRQYAQNLQRHLQISLRNTVSNYNNFRLVALNIISLYNIAQAHVLCAEGCSDGCQCARFICYLQTDICRCGHLVRRTEAFFLKACAADASGRLMLHIAGNINNIAADTAAGMVRSASAVEEVSGIAQELHALLVKLKE